VSFDGPSSGLRPGGAPDYFDRVRSTWNLSGDWSVIATYLSIFDVHFVRSPLTGRVRYRDIPVVGRNVSLEWPMVAAILKRPLPFGRRGYCDKNEILSVSIEADISVILVLMADWWIRQIETFVPEGAWIERGQVLAHIRMGSQVDVWVPSECVTFTRSHFDTVLAGETILGVKTSEPGVVQPPRRVEVTGLLERG
jgi:phosphatidylserine decarboxylase